MTTIIPTPPELLPEYHGTEGTRPQDFGQGDAYTNVPHFWANYLHYNGLFYLVSSNFLLLATLTRLHSIKFLFYKLEIWACNITSKSNYIFLSSFIVSFQVHQSALKHT